MTAVEWLQKQLFERFVWSDTILFLELIDKAKEMEKEQIIEAHTIGYVIGGGNGDLYNPKDYYNETFKHDSIN